MENVRIQQFNDEISTTGETDFILILRNAHSTALSIATLTNSSVIKEEGNLRAFAKISIKKTAFIHKLEDGFSAQPSYWNTFSNAIYFKSVFEQ